MPIQYIPGNDVVGGYRQNRQNRLWRKWISKCHNLIRAKITPRIPMKDEGCMLRAYHRRVVDVMVSSGEASTFIPALAMTYANNPAEVGVSHEARQEGTTSYNLYKLIRYNFDLITGFSLVPLQVFTMIGILVSACSGLLVFYLLMRRLIVGPEAEGLFTLFAILFFLAGLILLGLGILGEYIGRIYQEVLKRPRFVIRSELNPPAGTAHHQRPETISHEA
jgi:undecaprenyl-phosphate 4-deoxy-4-formamido-L-arabinose transferase